MCLSSLSQIRGGESSRLCLFLNEDRVVSWRGAGAMWPALWHTGAPDWKTDITRPVAPMSRLPSISMWSSRQSRRKDQWTVDEGLLRSLIPLNLLVPAEIKRLADQAEVFKLAPGARITKDLNSKRTLYLLSGIVEMLVGQEVTTVVAAGTETAKQPLLSAKAGRLSARARTDVMLLELGIDTDELLMHGADSADYEVSDISAATATDWLTRFLQARVFMKLPPSNIRTLLSRMEEIEVHAGQTIIRQGEMDDYYYIVKEGACRVTAQSPSGDGEIDVAELREGDGFGEDALITNGSRGATVTMVNEGRLMRLAKEDFTEMLVKPVLTYVDADRAQAMIDDGAALLDVRRPEEFAADGVRGALNIPLGLLRSRVRELAPQRAYITLSNVLNRSSSAAFLLCQQGMDVYILKGGAHSLTVKAVEDAASPCASTGMPANDRSPQDVADMTPPAAPVPVEIHASRPAPNEAATQIKTSPPTLVVVAPPSAASDAPPADDGRARVLAARLLSVKRRLADEIKRRQAAEGRLKSQEQQVHHLQIQMDKARQRLKKVFSLARAADEQRREAEHTVACLQDEKTALRREMDERGLRLAEVELQRRKLERTITDLGTRHAPQVTPPALRALAPPERQSAAWLHREGDRPAAISMPALLSAPCEAAGGGRGGILKGLAVWGLVALILSAALGVSVYGWEGNGGRWTEADGGHRQSSGHNALSSMALAPATKAYAGGIGAHRSRDRHFMRHAAAATTRDGAASTPACCAGTHSR